MLAVLGGAPVAISLLSFPARIGYNCNIIAGLSCSSCDFVGFYYDVDARHQAVGMTIGQTNEAAMAAVAIYPVYHSAWGYSVFCITLHRLCVLCTSRLVIHVYNTGGRSPQTKEKG